MLPHICDSERDTQNTDDVRIVLTEYLDKKMDIFRDNEHTVF